jgi:hypothetical protein
VNITKPQQPDSEQTSKRKKSVTLNDYGKNVSWKIADTACRKSKPLHVQGSCMVGPNVMMGLIYILAGVR